MRVVMRGFDRHIQDIPRKATFFGMWTMQIIRWQEFITSTPDVLRGKPRLKGTRIPVGLVLGYLAAGWTSGRLLEEFPDLTEDHLAACLDFARDLASFEIVV